MLAQVGRNTPMGNMLRRYWHPIAAVWEIDDRERKAVRLLGEDLVLFQGRDGRYGLIDQYCAHQQADMSLGAVEEYGFRCHLHGWLWNADGQCLSQGYRNDTDPSRPVEGVSIKAYRAEAAHGLVWAYLGPSTPAPPLPELPRLRRDDGSALVVMSEINCPWLQYHENALDPTHFEWLSTRRDADPRFGAVVTETEGGFEYRRVLAGEVAATPRRVLWPNLLAWGDQLEWHVPIDEARTLVVAWFFNRGADPQTRIPYWMGPSRDAQSQRWITYSPMPDALLDRLGGDAGVGLIRRRLLEEARSLAATGGR
jgi:5,5'-dehydrodivanillate O-demethylase